MFTTLVVRFILGVQVTQTGEYETPSERVTALAESNELICPRWRVTIPSCSVSVCFVCFKRELLVILWISALLLI